MSKYTHTASQPPAQYNDFLSSRSPPCLPSYPPCPPLTATLPLSPDSSANNACCFGPDGKKRKQPRRRGEVWEAWNRINYTVETFCAAPPFQKKKRKKKRFYLTRWFTHYLRASKIQQRRGRGSGRERGQRGESEEPRRVTREWMRLTGSNTNKKKTHTTYCSRCNNASTKKKTTSVGTHSRVFFFSSKT